MRTLKTAEERVAQEALSILRVNKRKRDDNTLIMLDGLNSHTIADSVNERLQYNDELLRVIKIMIFPRLGDSFARLIKRDSILSNDEKKINDVVSFRLKELFFVFSQFTLPSLMQDDINYIDMSRTSDNSLTKGEVIATIKALEECRESILKENFGNGIDGFQKYLHDYVEHLLLYFEFLEKHKHYSFPEQEERDRKNKKAKKKRRKKEVDLSQAIKGERSEGGGFIINKKKKTKE